MWLLEVGGEIWTDNINVGVVTYGFYVTILEWMRIFRGRRHWGIKGPGPSFEEDQILMI